MSNRSTTRGRTGTAAAAIATGLLLTVVGCSGGDGGGDDEKTPASSSQKNEDKPSGEDDGGDAADGQPLAQVKGGDDITLTIDSAERGDGGFVTLNGKVANNGSKVWVAPGWQGDETELSKNGASMAGAKLVDQKHRKRYYILRDTEGRCLCTKFNVGLGPGDSKSWYAQFPAPPESTGKVDFQIGDMPSASIEIGGE